MGRKTKILIILFTVAAVFTLLVVYLNHHNVAVLDPAGQIARKERNLFLFALGLSAVVVIPVFALTIMIAVKYREGNKNAKYTPEWDRSRLFETIWWGVPIIIIAVLSVITWNSSHSLDPYKPIASKTPAITVEVVALDWKWLFIYPGQNIATVNQMDIPLNTPVNLYLTSDTVMNSFWVPNLSGQIYAMPGMTTQLHLIADKTGSFYGSSANISGVGFSGMNFHVDSTSKAGFNNWLADVRQSPQLLDFSTSYRTLAKPSSYNTVSYYSKVNNNLFDQVVDKYMTSNNGNTSSMSMESAN
jgi:cytochrome o ubiquinol oxidase subunit 2